MSINDQAKVPIVAPASCDAIAVNTEVRRTLRMRLWDQTSVRQNLSSNLVTKGLSALVSLACVPIYLRVLGVSGYGLIGVWTMLESLANLLDLGLSPTMTRQMAAASTSVEAAQDARDLVRTLEVFYWLIGLVLGGAIILASPFLATHWLNSTQFSTHDLRNIMVLIGLLIFCRWPLSFYSGGITGLERQVLLSWVSFAFVCARSFGAVMVLLWVSPTIVAFFWWQVAINLLNTVAMFALLWKCLPQGRAPRFRLETLRTIRRFALGITGVAIVSMLSGDLDKLVVSKLLSLEEFGFYSLGYRIALTLTILSGPIFTAIFPAFSRYVASGDGVGLANAYHRAAQLMTLVVTPTAVAIAFFAKLIIFAWTGTTSTAERTCLLTSLLTAGTGLNCLISVPLALQFASGWTSLAFRTNLASMVAAIPLLLFLTKRFGCVGAASVWSLTNLSFLMTQPWIMHRYLLPGEWRSWFIRDVSLPILTCSTTAFLVTKLFAVPQTRSGIVLFTFIAGLTVGVAGSSVSPLVIEQVRVIIFRRTIIIAT